MQLCMKVLQGPGMHGIAAQIIADVQWPPQAAKNGRHKRRLATEMSVHRPTCNACSRGHIRQCGGMDSVLGEHRNGRIDHALAGLRRASGSSSGHGRYASGV